MYGIIYLHYCRPTKKIYIGQTTRTLKSRWRDRYVQCPLFGRVVKKYGIGAFDTAIIGRAETREELDNLEADCIRFYNSIHPNGYNLKDGGSGNGKHHPETLRKLSIASSGRKQTADHIAKRVAYHTGAQRSDESKQRMSKAKKDIGYKPSQDAIDAAREVVLGTRRSPETREKMRQSKLGIPRSAETRKKISEAVRAHNAKKLLSVVRPSPPTSIGISLSGTTL